MTQPRSSVTVVIATRDRAESVCRVVGAVLAQEHEPFDVLVVDDGSTDSTVACLSRIRDPRLTVIRSVHHGANAARNLGAERAPGDYLVFLDDDDAVRPGWLDALMEAADRTGAQLVSCAIERVDRNWENPVIETPSSLGPIFADLEARFLGGAFAVRADLFREVGGYPSDLPSNQQTGLALRIATRHERAPIVTATTPFVGLVWHQRRRGAPSISASFSRNRLRGTLMLLEQHPDLYARDPRERANYLAAAATCAARVGEYRTARGLYWRAFRSCRARRKDLLRIAATCVPPLARRTWPVRWDLPDTDPTGRVRIIEVVQDVAGAGAVARRVRDEVRTLRTAGHAVTVVANERPHPGAWLPPESTVLAVGSRVRMLRRSSVKPLVLGWGLRNVVRRERPGLLVVHHPVPARVVHRVARRAGVPMVVVVHSLVHDELRRGANPHRPATTAMLRAGERGLRHATAVAPVSDALTNTLLGLRVPYDRIRPIPNPVDTTMFRPGAQPPDVDVLFVGRLSPEKGPQDLLAACRRLPPGTRVTIAGTGRMRTELEALAAELAGAVTFTGFLGDDDLARLYRRARLVVVPSRSEALGMVVLEAMASGVPVVAARVGGIPGLVEQGVHGWLVEPGDVDALADTILDALAADLEPMRRAARLRAQEYGPAAFAARLLDAVGGLSATGAR